MEGSGSDEIDYEILIGLEKHKSLANKLKENNVTIPKFKTDPAYYYVNLMMSTDESHVTIFHKDQSIKEDFIRKVKNVYNEL